MSNYDDTVWNGLRQIIVYRGLIEKFSQNRELAEMLCSTGEAMLAECAVKDRICGIGLSMHDAERCDIQKGKGENLLGFALMEVPGEYNTEHFLKMHHFIFQDLYE